MPTWSFTKSPNIEDTVDELIKRIEWLTSKMDSKNVKRLDTNETVIKSADGTTYINGPVLEMTDASAVMRLKQGYDKETGDFIFKLYDASGNITIDLNSQGEAVFKGNIETTKDVTVGNNLYVGVQNSTVAKGVFFYNNSGNQSSVNMNAFGDLTVEGYNDLDLIAWFGDMDINCLTGNITIIAPEGAVVLQTESYIFDSTDPSYQIATKGDIASDVATAVSIAIAEHVAEYHTVEPGP